MGCPLLPPHPPLKEPGDRCSVTAGKLTGEEVGLPPVFPCEQKYNAEKFQAGLRTPTQAGELEPRAPNVKRILKTALVGVAQSVA